MSAAPRRVIDEASWQRTVVECAQRFGWRLFHDYDSKRNAPGFPDLVLIRDRSLIFAELKTQTGRLSTEQLQWMAAVSNVEAGVDEAVVLAGPAIGAAADRPSVEAQVWRPSDWDTVYRRLSRPRGSVRTVEA